jgi:hypothetical protein
MLREDRHESSNGVKVYKGNTANGVIGKFSVIKGLD